MSPTNKDNEITSRKLLSTKDLLKTWFRWLYACEISHSYERLQTLAFCYALVPALKKLYRKGEEFRKALKRHLVFFNTQGIWGGGTIIGVTLALEEERARAIAEKREVPDESVIISTKVGLMGPFAGIGDSIDWATLQYLLIAIAIPWAKSGLWIAAVFPFVLYVGLTYTYGFYFLRTSYNIGRRAAEVMLGSGRINKIIEGLSTLGLFMMGILGASYVHLSTPIKWSVGGKEFILQNVLDTILPGILPISVILLIYLYFLKKGMKVTQVLLYLIAIFFVLGLIGVF